MSSSVFENSSSYAPGVSVGMPTDATTFLENFTNKKGKVNKKAFKEFKEAGGDVQGVRNALEAPGSQYTAGQNMTQSMQNATANMFS